MQAVLNNRVLCQTEFHIEEIYRKVRRYVQSSAFNRALEISEKERFVVVSGLPGVGKSMLADILLYRHLEAGFEPIVIRKGTDEAKDLYRKGKKQAFHFDDFLGATFLGQNRSFLAENGDAMIVELINRCRSSPDKRLILTTREQLLSQSLSSSERFRFAGLIDGKCVLSVNDYSKLDKAKIVYNHFYFSDLPPQYIAGEYSDYTSGEQLILFAFQVQQQIETGDFVGILTKLVTYAADDWSTGVQSASRALDAFELIVKCVVTEKLSIDLTPLGDLLLKGGSGFSRARDAALVAARFETHSDWPGASDLPSKLDEQLDLYLTEHFEDDVANCTSEQEFEGLQNYLKDLGRLTGRFVDTEVDAVEYALDEFRANNDDFDDDSYRNWKAAQEEERANEEALGHMFDSLIEAVCD